MTAESSRLDRKARLTAVCRALPAATCQEKGDHCSFSVGKKVFAYYLHDHHGDRITSVCCRVLPGDNQRLIAANSGKFYMPAYIGPRGWVGLRLDRPSVDWKEVKELVVGSYMQIAPRRILGRLEDAESA
jgi:predicted DNA-binding protein (MmcQ/YjbR family)